MNDAGKIVTNYPGTCAEYWQATRELVAEDGCNPGSLGADVRSGGRMLMFHWADRRRHITATDPAMKLLQTAF